MNSLGRCSNSASGCSKDLGMVNIYYTCLDCFDLCEPTPMFNLCLHCFSGGSYSHQHGTFVDNYELLKQRRFQRTDYTAGLGGKVLLDVASGAVIELVKDREQVAALCDREDAVEAPVEQTGESATEFLEPAAEASTNFLEILQGILENLPF